MELSNENIIHIKKEKIEYLQFRKLLKYKDIMTHSYVIGLDKNFRTVKTDVKDTMPEEYNLAVKNYKEICNELKLDYNDIVKPQQTHSDNVKIITEKELKYEPDFALCRNTDGLITNKNHLVLSTTNADCMLLIFFDPVRRVIANVHSGWRGTLQRISVKTLQAMKDEYGCKEQDIICCFCPSIRKCHFEVDKDVYELFSNEFKDLENLDEIIKQKGNKWYIDTILINRTLLKKQGLCNENIIDSGICSVCNKEMIHSYRAEGANFGLGTAIVALK